MGERERTGRDVRPAAPPRNEQLEHLVLAKIARLGVACELSASAVYGPRFGVRNHELKVLNVLAYAEPMSMSELSRRAHIDKAWVSRSLAGLVQRGLVQKGHKANDERITLVQLTPEGETLVQRLAPTMLTREDTLLVGLDRGLVDWLLDTLLERLEAMRAAAT